MKPTNPYALSLDPRDFLRESGENFAALDNAWKNAKNQGMPVFPILSDCLDACLVHIDALILCGLRREALMTAVSMLISIDMCDIPSDDFNWPYIALSLRLLESAITLYNDSFGDEFALPHAQAVLGHAARLFLLALSQAPKEIPSSDALKITGMAESCRHFTEKHHATAFSKSESLVDIFARLHALND